jgi:lysophospholipase L1-like esterase
MASIVCFGDSITQGLVDLEGGWTQRLRRRLDQDATFPPGEVRFPATPCST